MHLSVFALRFLTLEYVLIMDFSYLYKYSVLLQISLEDLSFSIKEQDEICKIFSHLWATEKTL